MKQLTDFLKEHHVMCLATSVNNSPHATPLFYAVCEDPLRLIFVSDPKTRHMKEIAENGRISAGIYPETKETGEIRGVQLWGRAAALENQSIYADIYFKNFPHAKLYCEKNPGHFFYAVTVEKARLIDNRLGVGTKKEWKIHP